MKSKFRFLFLLLVSAAIVTGLGCRTTPGTDSAQRPTEPEGYSRIRFAEKLIALVNSGKFEAALALFDEIPPEELTTLPIRKLRLSVLLSAGDIPAAAKIADELEKENPEDADILYKQAVISLARNESAKRTQYLNRVLQISPNHSRAMTGLGLDFYSRENYPQARTWLIRALAAEPTNSDAILALGRVYYMQDDLSTALDTFSLGLSHDPENSILWAERARVRAESRDNPGAITDIRKAIELDNRIYSHWLDYGQYLMKAGQRSEAVQAYSKAIDIDPEFYLAYVYRAGLNDELGNLAQAEKDYGTITRLFPQYFYAFEGYGILLWLRGEWEGSRRAFQKALEFSPRTVSYALMATVAMYRSGATQQAQSFMSRYKNTLDRSSTEYLLCRLFVDQSAEMNVLNRIMRETNSVKRNRMLFYMGLYQELFGSATLAQKFYTDIIGTQVPAFFEYRLAKAALQQLEANTLTQR